MAQGEAVTAEAESTRQDGADADALRPAASEAADAVKPINILIVDDEPKNLVVLETLLDDPGYRLVRAATAEEALLAVLQDDFALLILDIHMPGTNGFELAKMIKQRRRTAQVPIIFLTAYYNDDDYRLEGYGSGAVDFLHKPVNAMILRSKVSVFAELHRKQQQLEDANEALRNEVATRRAAQSQLRDMNATLERQVRERTAHIDLLMNEVNHRSKNIFSLIMAITKQTAATHPTDFVETLSERIQALARNHDLVVNGKGGRIKLDALVRTQLAHFQEALDSRITIEGPSLSVTAAAGQSIGMAIHELATNAAKYGALKAGEGAIDIRWSVSDDEAEDATFDMSWTERGGPPVEAPKQRGFGTRVIKQMLELGLAGEVQLAYEQSGLRWRLRCASRTLAGGAREA
jgi:two-component sensor histidine kinase/CheY-like chemotaxis protein